jgi:hypothetical protein
MKTLLNLSLLVITSILFSGSICAQGNTISKAERYIVIDDISTFFVPDKLDSNIIDCNFELYNIYEDESSKPVFVDVSELRGVVKFSIKSNSERFENQRSCSLKLSAQNYTSTFRLALSKMKVKNIMFKGNLITVESFFNSIM